jgi:hypothetical protein
MGYSFVYNSGNYEEEKPSEKLHLEFGVFFDGTLNNKEHTALRLKVLNIDDLIIYPSDSEKTVRWKEQELAKRRERIHQGGLSKEDKYAFEIKIKKDYYEKKRVVPTQEEVRQILQDIINKDVKDYERADKRDWLDKQGVDNSFMNDYTNVARLYMSCDKAYAIYIEGIGTLNRQKDVDAGFQYGSGTSGIRFKVRKGCNELAKKIIDAKKKGKQKKITSLSVTVDVFGFSRGATAARNFLYEVNSTHKREKDIVIKKQTKKVLDKDLINPYSPNDDSVYTTKEVFTGFYIDKDNVIVNMDYIENDHMPKYGYLGYYLLENGFSKEELQNMTLSIRFLGIYDTVSSYEDVGDLNALSKIDHGIKHTRKNYFKDDVEQLQINNLGYFKQAVHFVAMDEHRQNFALTHLKGTNCKEKVLPGVHSDIGGGYETGIEVVDELEVAPLNNIILPYLKKQKELLVKEYWYKEEQTDIVIDHVPKEMAKKGLYIYYFNELIRLLRFRYIATFNNYFFYNKLRGIRFLKKEYSYIPLHLMEKAFRKVLWGRSAEKIIKIPTGKGYPFPKEKTIQEKFGINKEGVLETAQKILDAYVFGDKNKWEFLSDDKLGAILKKEKEKLSLRKPISIKEKEQGKQTEINSQQIRDKIPSQKPLPLDKEEIQLIQEVKKKNPIFEEQQILRILRNQYLHWSANKDWFGMQPAPGRKRDTY